MSKISTQKQTYLSTYFRPSKLINWSFLLLFLIGSYYSIIWVFLKIFPDGATYSQSVIKIMYPLGTMSVLLLNGYYFCLYYFEIPIFEKYKVNSTPWPWKENAEHFWKYFPSAIRRYITNYVIFNVFLLLIGFYIQPSLSKESIPSIPVYLLQILFCIFCEDFFFYWVHRMLHHPLLYSKIHKHHHEFYNVVSVACINMHWIEFIMAGILPSFSSLCILGKRMHLVTFFSFNFLRIVETHECHSGYEFSWSMFGAIPFMNESKYHNFHHLKNMGNYASFFRFWDSLFGTNMYYLETTDN